MIALGGGFTTAGAILIAQHTGAESGEDGLIAGQTLSFVSLVAIGLGIVGFVATDPMLALLPAQGDTEAAIVPLAADYLRIFFLGSRSSSASSSSSRSCAAAGTLARRCA